LFDKALRVSARPLFLWLRILERGFRKLSAGGAAPSLRAQGASRADVNRFFVKTLMIV